jgi:hypothetical protein
LADGARGTAELADELSAAAALLRELDGAIEALARPAVHA